VNKFISKFELFIQTRWRALVLIFALTLVAYIQLYNKPFLLDDHDYVESWQLIKDWHNIPKFFFGYTTPNGQEGVFAPLKTLIHAINYHLFGLTPWKHYVFSMGGYLLIIFSVYNISIFILKDRLQSFLCTLFFALHPIHIEYLTITGGVDAIGVLFLFIAFFYYISSLMTSGGEKKKYIIVAMIFSCMAIFLNELCLVLPILFLWYDFCYSHDIRNNNSLSIWKRYRKIVGRNIPFFSVALFYALCKYLTFGSVTRGEYLYGSFYLTMLVTIKAWAKYIFIMFFPITLTHDHVISKGIYSFGFDDFDQFAVLSQSLFEPQVLFSLLVLGYIVYLAYKYYNIDRLITFCIGWFFLSLLVSSNIIPCGVLFAERYIFIGSLGFCLLFGYLIGKLLKSKSNFFSILGTMIVLIVVLFFMIRIFLRVEDMRSDVTVYESAIRANPHSALMRKELGIVATEAGDYDKAIKSFKKAIALRPNYPLAYFAMAEAYLQKGDIEHSKHALEEAIRLDPEYAEAYYNLAGLYAYEGNRLKAERLLNKAIYYYRKQGKEKEAAIYGLAFREYFKLPD